MRAMIFVLLSSFHVLRSVVSMKGGLLPPRSGQCLEFLSRLGFSRPFLLCTSDCAVHVNRSELGIPLRRTPHWAGFELRANA